MALICGTAVLEMPRGLHYSTAVEVEFLRDFKVCVWHTQGILIQGDTAGREWLVGCTTYTTCMFLMRVTCVTKNTSL